MRHAQQPRRIAGAHLLFSAAEQVNSSSGRERGVAILLIRTPAEYRVGTNGLSCSRGEFHLIHEFG